MFKDAFASMSATSTGDEADETGVSIGRPPANGLPSLAVWQATQSPRRAT